VYMLSDLDISVGKLLVQRNSVFHSLAISMVDLYGSLVYVLASGGRRLLSSVSVL
jgi:hypothetical protein